MSGIRVIAGTARGRRLQLVPGDSTRPITDRVKENLFNIIGREIVDAEMLDAFAGTGSVGIEALSRGARSIRFLDLNRQAILTIQANLAVTGFTSRAQVQQRDALAVLASAPDQPFDYIFIAPPQYHGLWLRCLEILDRNPGWLKAGGEVVVQIDPKEWQDLVLESFEVIDQRRYGNTMLAFFAMKGSPEAGE